MKKIAYGLGLVTALAVTVLLFSRVFSFKFTDGIYQMKTFYELENDTVDTLILGSSHAFVNINPMIMWDEAENAAFGLCGSKAPLWNSYYYLKEALKTQSPQLVILEGFGLTQNEEYMDDSRIIKNVYGLKSMTNKIDSLKASAPRERWREFGFEYIQYHNRYKDLSASDFEPYMDNEMYYSSWKGFGESYASYSFERPDVINDGSKIPLSDKQEDYYRKIIELCQDRHIPLLVAVVPYPDYSKDHMKMYNSAKAIADEYGVDFCNFNDYYDEIDFNWNTDFVDGDHMGYIGNVRFTKYLIKYLQDNFIWKSHVNDRERYSSWDAAVRYYKNNLANLGIMQIEDIEYYAEILQALPDRYIAIVNAKGTPEEYNLNQNIIMALDKWGISVTESDRDSAWVVTQRAAQAVSTTSYGYYWTQRYGNKELLVDGKGIYWNRQNYQRLDNGINIVIFDTENRTVADSIGLYGDVITR